MIKRDFLKIWAKIANLGGAESEKFKYSILDRKGSIFDPLKRNRKPFFNIMSGLNHRPLMEIYIGWSLNYFEEYTFHSHIDNIY